MTDQDRAYIEQQAKRQKYLQQQESITAGPAVGAVFGSAGPVAAMRPGLHTAAAAAAAVPAAATATATVEPVKKKKKKQTLEEHHAKKELEQQKKQSAWLQFTKKAGTFESNQTTIIFIINSRTYEQTHVGKTMKKPIINEKSIFKTSENPLAKVGVVGSGRPMTEAAKTAKHQLGRK